MVDRNEELAGHGEVPGTLHVANHGVGRPACSLACAGRRPGQVGRSAWVVPDAAHTVAARGDDSLTALQCWLCCGVWRPW